MILGLMIFQTLSPSFCSSWLLFGCGTFYGKPPGPLIRLKTSATSKLFLGLVATPTLAFCLSRALILPFF